MANAAGNLASMGNLATEETYPTGGNEALNIMNPVIYYWAIVKT